MYNSKTKQLLFRGYYWEFGTQEIVVTARSRLLTIDCVIARVSRQPADALDCSPQDLENAARDLWRSVHGHRQLRSDLRPVAVDLAPWEIHEIQDEAAYLVALEEFNRENKRA